MSFRRSHRATFALAAVLSAGFAAPAKAQFTSYVAHPPRVDSAGVPILARTDSARKAQSDSAQRVAITNMKSWVDSAAIAAGTRVPAPAESGITDTSTAAATSSGIVPPDTATPLPAVLLAGMAAITAGAALLRRRR